MRADLGFFDSAEYRPVQDSRVGDSDPSLTITSKQARIVIFK